jgi:predicted porin
VGTTHTGGINATVRANSAIYYRTPSLGGLSVHAAIAAGEGQTVPVGTSTSAERPVGFAVAYAAGPIRVALAYDRERRDFKTLGLYAGYNAGFANVMFQYEKGDQVGFTSDVDRWSLSTKVPLGAVTFKAGYTSWSDEEVKKLGLGLQYDLSKRTNLYTNIGKISGDGASSNAKKTMFDLGVTHAF